MLAEGSGPPVLLLHGSGPGTTGAAWAPLIAALATAVLASSRPTCSGFGDAQAVARAGGAAMPPGRRRRASSLDGLGEPCAVVGNSAGGAIALSLAHARPRAVTRVVAVGSMGHPMTLPRGAGRAVGLRSRAARPRARWSS